MMKNMDLADANLKKIIEDDSYGWIEIEPWLGRKSLEGSTWKESYDGLMAHHKAETEYLVELMRTLAAEILQNRERLQKFDDLKMRLILDGSL